MDKLVTSTITATLALVIALPTGLALLTGAGPTPACADDVALAPAAATAPLALPSTSTSSAASEATSAWDGEQVANAATILAVGTRLRIPAWGQVIALAAAMQESSLRNLPGGDRDSVGLFQQRPSAGWGTPAQIRDPAYAAERFYRALLAVPGWQTLPLTESAQAVQRSAFPLAYADDEEPAASLFAFLTGTAPTPAAACVAIGGEADGSVPAAPEEFTPPAGMTGPVALSVGWALLQVGTPYSYGGDCTAALSGRAEHQCDCSSLTQQALLHAGISLPRTAAAQSREGVPVPLTALQPGDLLFSAGADGTPTEPGHVAMALGNGWIIEAPRTGLTVRVARLTPARAATIVAARRVLTP